MTTIEIPDPSLVVLVGASGSGKSTFARTHFGAFETVSSDACRALVANDENDQSATSDAFDVLHLIVERRLRRGLLTVVDATSLHGATRRPLLGLAHRAHLPATAIVLNMPDDICQSWNMARPDRQLPPEVIHQLYELFVLLGWARGVDGVWRHPQSRRAVFVGDLVDRGPRVADVLRMPSRCMRTESRSPCPAITTTS